MMEKHLGWIVGGVSALLIGVTTPLMVFAGTVQNGSSNAPISTPSTAVSQPGTTNSQLVPSALQQPTLPEKIRFVGSIAVNAAGGGTVTNTSVQNTGSQSVWTVTVHQASGDYQVQVSSQTYSVLDVKQIN